MEMVDSNEQQLSAQQIIMAGLESRLPAGADPKQAAASILAEVKMPYAHLVQHGNTLFIGHVDKKDNSVVWGRAINMDTAYNFLQNGWEYFNQLYDMGVRTYVSMAFNKTQFEAAFKIFEKYKITEDTKVEIKDAKDKPGYKVAIIHFKGKRCEHRN